MAVTQILLRLTSLFYLKATIPSSKIKYLAYQYTVTLLDYNSPPLTKFYARIILKVHTNVLISKGKQNQVV